MVAKFKKIFFCRQSLEWLEYKAKIGGKFIHIQHNLNGGKKKILGTQYKVDCFVLPRIRWMDIPGVYGTGVRHVS